MSTIVCRVHCLLVSALAGATMLNPWLGVLNRDKDKAHDTAHAIDTANAHGNAHDNVPLFPRSPWT